MKNQATTLENLGYNDFFEQGRKNLRPDVFKIARVTAAHKNAYRIKNPDGEYLATVTGKQVYAAQSKEDFPAVGDWVAITPLDSEKAVINGILPRKSIIKRTHGQKNEIQIIGANIDVAFAVQSVGRDYSLNRFERYFVIIRDGGVQPAIILNKVDLISQEELRQKLDELKARFPGMDIIAASTISGNGLDALKAYIAPGKTYCFLGSSGVGKSSLINKLLGDLPTGETLATDDISTYSDRGKHVTTGRQIYFLQNNGIVIDNPGMREVGTAEAGQGVDEFFDEITSLAAGCKYADCTHVHEPDCAILAAVKSGELDKEKYDNYLGLKKEASYYEMNDYEKRKKDRQFGKFLKKAKKELKDSGHKN